MSDKQTVNELKNWYKHERCLLVEEMNSPMDHMIIAVQMAMLERFRDHFAETCSIQIDDSEVSDE